MKNSLNLVTDALPQNVAVARIAVATFAACADFSAADVEEIKVAVSEAVSNSVLHAYPESLGKIAVRAEINADNLEITVQDFGTGIRNTEAARQAGFSTLEDHMGLGFSFMDSFMDVFALHSVPGKGTSVRMVKMRCKE